MNFRKLTLQTGEEVWINLTRVEKMTPKPAGTELDLEYGPATLVKEKIEEIFKYDLERARFNVEERK